VKKRGGYPEKMIHKEEHRTKKTKTPDQGNDKKKEKKIDSFLSKLRRMSKNSDGERGMKYTRGGEG